MSLVGVTRTNTTWFSELRSHEVRALGTGLQTGRAADDRSKDVQRGISFKFWVKKQHRCFPSHTAYVILTEAAQTVSAEQVRLCSITVC